MDNVFYDTETVGLCGPAVLIQWAKNDEPIQLHSVWNTPIHETLTLIERFMECCTIGFNLSFDHFQLSKLYTMLSLYPDKDAYPEDIVEELALLEPKARDGPCLKPASAFDIMLHARKGPYQSTMDRHDILIKRVPTGLAWQLCDELEKRVKLPDIYFARKKDKTAQWQVDDVEDSDGEIDTDWKNISLRFKPSSALKALATDALKLEKDKVLLFHDIELDKKFYPEELKYAPFALAIGKPGNWKGAWPEKIKFHITHWGYHKIAREYAKDDVDYTRRLYHYFGSPKVGDDDSILACMVAAIRWKGFKADILALEKLKEKALKSKSKILPNGKEFVIPTSPAKARIYVTEFMDETEKLIVDGSTKKVLLQEISKWAKDCPKCNGKGCHECNEGKMVHPAAIRATEILEARMANYEADLYSKFIVAGRFHASFVVIGALSSRMAGADGLNAQGIKKAKVVRSCFPLAWPGMVLSGGDFAGFEVTLAEASYGDADLRRDLLTCEKCECEMEFIKERSDFICKKCGGQEGKAIHALFGVFVFPEYDYWSLKKTKGTADDKYTRAKSGVFALMYGGTEYTLEERLGVPSEVAIAARAKFYRKYPGVARSQQRIVNDFSSMRQPGGIGSKVEWHQPKDFVESLFGFRRYFTLENQICKALYDLAQKPPTAWKDLKIRVQRRDRMQTAMGAVQSALFAAAFALQSSNTRAAVNHEIQSSGATITKEVQRKIWNIQPSGINPFIVMPMNVHDELMVPTKPEYADQVKSVVNEAVESFRPKVPLIKMDWNIQLESWADK